VKTDRPIMIVPDFMIVMRAMRKGMETLSEIHYKTKITYSHLCGVRKLLEDKQWIVCKKQGRKNLISLTDKGEEIVDVIEQLFEVLGINEENLMKFRAKTKERKSKMVEEAKDKLKEIISDEPVEQIDTDVFKQLPKDNVLYRVPEKTSEEEEPEETFATQEVWEDDEEVLEENGEEDKETY